MKVSVGCADKVELGLNCTRLECVGQAVSLSGEYVDKQPVVVCDIDGK